MADEGKKGTGGGLGDLVKAEAMIQLAIALPVGCFVGWLIGSALDKHFHTDWMMIVGIAMGAVAGFVQIYRTAQSFLKGGRG